jgi:hypothetical protein
MYNVEHRFIFVEVPRTGTTSIGTALRANLPFDDSEALTGLSPDHPLAGHTLNRFHKALRHATISVLRQRSHLQGYRSFGFCRNPFARALSWFVHGQRDAPFPSAQVRAAFTAHLGHLRNIYVHPSFYYLSDGERLAVDRVGRFERLHEDFADICRWLGIGQLRLPHLNGSNFPVPYSEYYTSAARDLVLRHAARDFERFGYDTALA